MQPAEHFADDSLKETALDECPVDHIVKHVGSRQNLKYLACWYGYKTAEDTFKLPHHIPEHFMKL